MNRFLNKVIIINQRSMGQGNTELGEKLMGAFLKKIWAKEEKPKAICFYNNSVELLTKGSPVLDALDGLERAGVELLACGTCVDFYGLGDAMALGHISNMEEIVTLMLGADSVITI